MLSTKIYLLTSRAEEGYHYGAAQHRAHGPSGGVVLMVGYLWAVRVSARFAVVTGKGYRPVWCGWAVGNISPSAGSQAISLWP